MADKPVVKVVVRVFEDGTVDMETSPKFKEMNRAQRLLVAAGLAAAEHCVHDDAMRRVREEGRG